MAKEKMITIIREPNTYSFTGNSIIFEILADNPDMINAQIIVNGNTRNTSYYPYLEDNLYKVRMEISDFLIQDLKPLVLPQGKIIAPLPDFGLAYQVKIDSEYSFEGFAFMGGITNHDFKILAENGFDIFTYRLGSYFNQFLFTTRTHSKEIKLRETELYPFVFINPGLDFTFKSESGNSLSISPSISEKVCVLDIQALRERFQILFNETPNRFEVSLADDTCFIITIEPGQISEEKYLIRFRNSLGAYEVIEIVGKAIHAPELADENKYSIFNNYDFFEDRRERVSSKGVIEVETGFKHRRELPFIMDMIQSDEIYFIYPDESYFRCHVKTDQAKYRHKMVTPTSISLIISEVTDEVFVSPSLDRELLFSGSGIFDATFDDSFE